MCKEKKSLQSFLQTLDHPQLFVGGTVSFLTKLERLICPMGAGTGGQGSQNVLYEKKDQVMLC